MYNIINSDVIFDEYHELISTNPMFACFINIMKVRHKFLNVKTLLLSATPTIMEFLWNSFDGNKTIVLPNNETHYEPAHEGKYVINMANRILNTENNSVTILNSVSNAQRTFIQNKSDILFHSYYMDDDKNEILKKIYKIYGTKNNQLTKDSVVSAPIIQASMDISFLSLNESTMSPETTLQRIGRCDRWGNLQNFTPTINLIFYDNNSELYKSETTAIQNQYDIKLNNLWKKYLNQHIVSGNKYSLQELYETYNKFNKQHKEDLRTYINEKYNKSLECLSEIYPYKIFFKTGKKYKSASSKLRGGKNNIYCIYQIDNENVYTDPFLVDYDKTIKNDESNDKHSLKKIQKALKTIINCNDSRFDYNKYQHLNNGNLMGYLKDCARNPRTPYVTFNKTYNKKFGLIKNEMLMMAK